MSKQWISLGYKYAVQSSNEVRKRNYAMPARLEDLKMKSFPTSNLKLFLSRKETIWGMVMFCIMQLALLSSQSGMDFFSGVLFLTSVYWTIRYYKKEWSWPRIGLGWLWAIWLTTIALGLALNPLNSPWPDLFFEFRWIIDLYVFTLFLSLYGDDKKVFRFFAIVLSVCSLTALIIYFLGYNPLSEPSSQRAINFKNFAGWRAGGLFDHSMPLAHSYGPILLVFSGILLANWKERKNLTSWIYVAILLTAATVLLTFTRGVWIGVVCGFVAMGFLMNRRRGLILLGGVALTVLLVLATNEKIRDRVMVTVNLTNQGDHERLTLWKTNWEMFKEHPLIGTGYEQNKARLREYYDRMGVPAGYFEGHAHNQYMHFLAGTGIIGILCYLYFIFYSFQLSYRAYIQSPNSLHKGIALGCLGAMICFHIGSLTESNFSIGKNRFMILFIIAWSVSIYLKQKKQPENSQS
jgi:O-antigen ligase